MSALKKFFTKKRIIVISVVLALVLLVLPAVSAAVVCECIFSGRSEPDPALRLSAADFPGLRAERYEFSSDEGQTLTGYRYYRDGVSPEAVVILAHGLGSGGQSAYLACADYFASNGFTVFAYDATGHGESGGSGPEGLPQGVIDLDYAISFVEENPDFGGLPVVLFGHSWGAYSACAVLQFHPEVRAAAALAGFNDPADFMKYSAAQKAGKASGLLMPYVRLWQRLKFGRYAGATAADGFAATETRVMVVQSADDTVVPPEYGFNLYRDAYGENERFSFVLYRDRGHNVWRAGAARAFAGRTDGRDGLVSANAVDLDLFRQITEFYSDALAQRQKAA